MSAESLEKVVQSIRGTEFDLIIDDGLHFVSANLNSIIAFLPLVAEGGFLVVEDIPPRSEVLWEVVSHFIPEGYKVSKFVTKRGSLNFVIQET